MKLEPGYPPRRSFVTSDARRRGQPRIAIDQPPADPLISAPIVFKEAEPLLHHDLSTVLKAPSNLVDGVIPAKSIKAGEWIIKHDDLLRTACVLFELGEKKRAYQRAAITRAEGVLETRAVVWRGGIAEIDRVLVDHDLVVGAGRTAAIGMRRRRNPEARIHQPKVAILRIEPASWTDRWAACSSNFFATIRASICGSCFKAMKV